MAKANCVVATPAKEPPTRFGKPVFRHSTKAHCSFYIGMWEQIVHCKVGYSSIRKASPESVAAAL